jgi:hypothetical protein
LLLLAYMHGRSCASGTLMHYAPCWHKKQTEVDVPASLAETVVENFGTRPREESVHLCMLSKESLPQRTPCGCERFTISDLIAVVSFVLSTPRPRLAGRHRDTLLQPSLPGHSTP